MCEEEISEDSVRWHISKEYLRTISEIYVSVECLMVIFMRTVFKRDIFELSEADMLRRMSEASYQRRVF